MKSNLLRAALSALLACALLFSSALAVEQGFTVFNGSRESNRIAITVDDCYNDIHITSLLDLCEQYNIPVTFFIIGRAISPDEREVWQRALDLGCEIGNHTNNHISLPKHTSERIIKDLREAQNTLDEVLGYHYAMQVMRPPYGNLSRKKGNKSDVNVVNAIAEAGYLHAVCWDVCELKPERALKAVQNGSILLFHANPKDIGCLTELIPALLEAGYEPVTVSQLLGLPEPMISDGESAEASADADN